MSTSFLYFPVSITDLSLGNSISIKNTTVQKEIFVGNGSIQKIPFRQFFFFEKWIWYKLKRKWKKQKVFGACRNGQTESSGSESCWIQSQDGQELGSPAAATTHIPQTSGVTQSVDLAERICDITYPISSSPCYSEDIHTKITMVLLKWVMSQG